MGDIQLKEFENKKKIIMPVFTINSKAVSFLRVFGGYDARSPEGACKISVMNDFLGYIPEGTTLNDTSKIYEEPKGPIGAPSGWYSDGTIVRYWDNDFGIFKETMTCP